MKHIRFVIGITIIGAISGIAAADAPQQKQPAAKLKTRNILLVTSDGLRWQDVFGGADLALLNKEDGRDARAAPQAAHAVSLEHNRQARADLW